MGSGQSVVVLGATGMLGSLTHHYLRQTGAYDVWGTVRASERERIAGQPRCIELDASSSDSTLARALAKVRPHWIINCIGIIKPYCKDDDPAGVRGAIAVNALFPYRLAAAAQKLDARVIQIATDCVYSGREGNYSEVAPHDPLDAYGKTKSLGEVKADTMLHIRCSIIGPEPWNKLNLMEWFLSQPDGARIPGFTHHRWNGVTTLQFVQCCQMIIENGPRFFDQLVHTSPVHHFAPNETVTKYELLCLLQQAWKKPVEVVPTSPGPPIDRSLTTRFNRLTPTPHHTAMRQAIKELKDYIDAKN